MNDIKELLLIGEKVNMECKEAKSSMPKSAYETYSSFANTDGGCINIFSELTHSGRNVD